MSKRTLLRTYAAAERLDDYQGKRAYRFPVRVQLNDSMQCRTVATYTHEVISHTAAHAADYVRDLYSDRAETEITVYGPKGGKAAYRYVGWTSAIGSQVFRGKPSAYQLGFVWDVAGLDGGYAHAG